MDISKICAAGRVYEMKLEFAVYCLHETQVHRQNGIRVRAI